MTLTRVLSIVEWGLGTWLKKVKGHTAGKDAEAVTIDNLIKKKRRSEVAGGER